MRVLRFFLDTRLAVVAGERHAMAAPDEMKELADEIRVIRDRTHTPSPASSALAQEIERQLHAVSTSQDVGPEARPRG
jgi:hypothetical protein